MGIEQGGNSAGADLGVGCCKWSGHQGDCRGGILG